MSVRNFEVRNVSRSDIRDFIEANHYSQSINGCIADYCFALFDGGKMIGLCFTGVWLWQGNGSVFPPRRLMLRNFAAYAALTIRQKNTESYFIGKTLRWLRKNTNISTVVSYADAEHGHTGVIYKASNFTLEGFRKGARVIVHNGKQYHDKTIRTKYKGELKPFALKVKNALESGEAVYKDTAGKYCYVYTLGGKHA